MAPSVLFSVQAYNRCSICNTIIDKNRESDFGFVTGNTTRFIKTNFSVWKCPNCQSIHSLNVVDFADIYKDYPVNLLQTLDAFARGRFANLLSRLKQACLKKEHRILDMGCGNGIFIKYLKSKGYNNCFGFDPYVKEFSHLDRTQSFEFIVANDVIEHVVSPSDFLKECSELLCEDGTIYIGTADSDDVEMQHLDQDLLKLHQPFHRVIVNQNTLEKLAREIPNCRWVKSYRRSYMDTLIPFVNYRFLDELNAILGYEMDLAFRPGVGKAIFKNPHVLFYAFFGYFFPSAAEPAVVAVKNRKNEKESA